MNLCKDSEKCVKLNIIYIQTSQLIENIPLINITIYDYTREQKCAQDLSNQG